MSTRFVMHPSFCEPGAEVVGGPSKHVDDLKLTRRLEFGSAAVAMRYEPREVARLASRANESSAALTATGSPAGGPKQRFDLAHLPMRARRKEQQILPIPPAAHRSSPKPQPLPP